MWEGSHDSERSLVIWKDCTDLQRLDGRGCLGSDEERAPPADVLAQRALEEVCRRRCGLEDQAGPIGRNWM